MSRAAAAAVLTTPAPGRLYQEIAARLEAFIDEGRFPIGSRMPAERELARSLQVSRPSVREAIIALEVAGIVEVRQGSGVYVVAAPASASMLSRSQPGDAGPGPYEVLEARRLIEGETCYLAAGYASDEQLARLREAIDAMRKDAESPAMRGEHGDRTFHMLIAQASNNSALASIVRDLWDARSSPLWRRWIQRTRTIEIHLRRVDEHAEIYELLCARRADAARAAMHRHIDSVKRRFLMVD